MDQVLGRKILIIKIPSSNEKIIYEKMVIYKVKNWNTKVSTS